MEVFLNYGVLFLGNVANLYMIDNFFYNFFEVKGFAKLLHVRLSVGALYVIVVFGINLLHNSLINLAFYILLTLAYVVVIFTGNFWSRLFRYVFALCILIGGEFLFVVLISAPYYIVGQAITTNISAFATQYFMLKLLTYILFTITKQMSGKAKEHMPNKIFGMYICLPITTLAILILTYYAGAGDVNNPTITLLLVICSGLMFLGNILIFYAFHQHARESYHKNQMEIAALEREMNWKHHTQMIVNNEEHQKFIHNIVNQLKVINGLARQGEKDKISKIIRGLESDIEKNETKEYCKHPIINILLSEKEIEAEANGVEIDIFIEQNIYVGDIREVDLIAAIGNLLDNAIRGASESVANKKIKVKIFMRDGGNVFVVKIVNEFGGEIKRKDGKFISTKKGLGIRGVGIKSVEDIASVYRGNLNCSVEGTVFQAVLALQTK